MKISVIIPVYKVEKYLDKCVESIVNQTYKNLEIILVDDGSPDNCPAMCDVWAEKDERIRVIHKENGGLADARNAGMDIATGDYIGFVDSDDWIEPNMYEMLLKNALKYDADISRCGLSVNCENGENNQWREIEFSEVHVLDNFEYTRRVIQGGYLNGAVWNKIYKKETVGSYRFMTEDGASEDIMFNNRVSSQMSVCVCEDLPLYNYLRRVGSITISEFGYGAFSIIRAKEHFLNQYKDNREIYPLCVKSYVTSAFIVLSGVITNQKCLDKYDFLRNGILQYKRKILFDNIYSKRDKIKTFLLWISPKLYNFFIRKNKNI